MKYKAPDPGEGWRLMNKKESPVPMDAECIALDIPGDHWERSNWQGQKNLRESDIRDPALFYRTRQGVEHAKKKKPEPNWKRLCSLMAKAKTIREAREIYNKGVGK